MKLVVGLGNPGRIYTGNRHNIGFMCLDRLAARLGVRFRRGKWADTTVALVDGRRLYLAKPLTFMNESGRAVAGLLGQTGLSVTDVIAVYDDLDLPLGRLRLRPEGGAGGHKGMRSIIDLMGTQAFPRLRMGIDRPPGRMDPADYVLQPFDKDQSPLVAGAVEEAVAAIECWLAAGIVAAMGKFNQPARGESPCLEDQE